MTWWGQIGDRFGYKLSCTLGMILACVCVSFEYIPRHQIFVRQPLVTLQHNGRTLMLDHIMFPPNDCREDFTSDNCAFDRNMDWGLLKQSLRCKNRTSDVDIRQLTLEEPKSNVNVSTFTLSGNGSFCSWKFQTQEGSGRKKTTAGFFI